MRAMVSGVDLVAMFVLGLLGAGHCLSMCAPIAGAIAVGCRARSALVTLLYNLGRGATYVALGAMVAGLGAGAAQLAPVLRVQAWLTLAAAGFLGWFGLSLLGLLPEPRTGIAGALPGAGPLLRRLAGKGSAAAAFPLGLLLGFLPCGLSVAALTRALGAPRAIDGALLVAAFWAGTLPAMLGAGALLARLPAGRRREAQLLSGAVLVGMATLNVSRAAPMLLG